jgi:hypothetical protein
LLLWLLGYLDFLYLELAATVFTAEAQNINKNHKNTRIR